MAVATKTAKKASPAPKGISRLLKKLVDREDYASLLKTAVQTGFLSDGVWVTKLSADEAGHLRQIKETVKGYRKAEVRMDPRDLFPKIVGSEVAAMEASKSAVVVQDFGGNSYRVHPLLQTMVERHPRASVHFAVNKKDFIYISVGTEVVACVPMLKDE